MNNFKLFVVLALAFAVVNLVAATPETENLVSAHPPLDINPIAMGPAAALGTAGVIGQRSVARITETLQQIGRDAKSAFDDMSQYMSQAQFASEPARAAFGLGVTAMGTWLTYILAQALQGQRFGTAGMLALPGIYGASLAAGTVHGALEHFTK